MFQFSTLPPLLNFKNPGHATLKYVYHKQYNMRCVNIHIMMIIYSSHKNKTVHDDKDKKYSVMLRKMVKLFLLTLRRVFGSTSEIAINITQIFQK